MKKGIAMLLIVLIGLAFQSCENKTIQQEVEEYCNCQKSVQNGEREMKECLELANEISDKYQFDPEASEQIRQEIKNCSDEPNEGND